MAGKPRGLLNPTHQLGSGKRATLQPKPANPSKYAHPLLIQFLLSLSTTARGRRLIRAGDDPLPGLRVRGKGVGLRSCMFGGLTGTGSEPLLLPTPGPSP
eukprot:4622463-Amphidinium_carterae.3